MHVTDLSVIVKPTHQCNFSCRYCYNEDQRLPIMKFSTLKNLLDKSFEYAKNKSFKGVNFIWHGGEPLLCGIDFYKKIINLEKRNKSSIPYKNSIQTNGSLINEEWVNFFQKYNIEVSVSLDGPREHHNKTRIFSDGTGTFDKVMEGINFLREKNIKFGVVLVITKENKDYVEEILDFFSKNKFDFHFVPLTKQGNAVKNFEDLGLGANEYADSWIKMYDKWIDALDSQYVFCKEFVNRSASMLSNKCLDCTSLSQCGNCHISVDPEGFVYPCSTFSPKKKWSYENINEDSLTNMMNNSVAAEACNREKDFFCQKCKWQSICNGGCPSRAYNFFKTIHRRDYYCPSLKKIFLHISNKMKDKKININKGI